MRFGFPQHNFPLFSIATCFILSALFLTHPIQTCGQDDSASSQTSTATAKEISMEFLSEGTAPTSIEQLKLMEEHVRKIADMVKPATVNIAVGESQGTGVVISRDGYILTAAHVISRPGLNARITFPDGEVAFATTLGTHPGIDSGMLKLKKPGKWPYLDVGESEPLKRGQWVIAVGHPGGLDRDRGLVVRVGRLIYKTRNVLRTDCTLVGGDSGGPLVDMDGHVIGIHSRIGSNLTDNLHVPIDIFSEEWDLLADEFGVIVGSTTAYLGLSLDANSNRVNRVTQNQPAAKAGIKVGDKIIRIDDQEIKEPADLRKALRSKKPRDQITVKVLRDKKRRNKDPETSEEQDKDAEEQDKDAEEQDKDSEEQDKDSEEQDKDAEEQDKDAEEQDKDSEEQDKDAEENEQDADDEKQEKQTKEVELEIPVTLGYG
ncbi:MAG: trypsin-like peptidase domain-containing protein [Mariniblastus sp.]|nr:trypsin-like peptidase domain-containing protein [Mariniblastus sp.]